jgi:recombination protein RecA
MLEAQWRGEPVAWITLPSSTFFPPDAAAGGIDLSSLAVVRARDSYTAARSAMQLVRSGGFGLVAIDLGPKPPPASMGQERVNGVEYTSIPTPLQTRLVGLAQKHDTAVVVLTEKPAHASSLGSLVSLRAEARRPSVTPYRIELSVLKDKRRGPGQVHRETCRGPAGMC